MSKGRNGLSAVLLCCALVVPGSAFAAQTEGSTPQASLTETSLFQIVLLIGDKQPSKSSGDVPENARAAIDDIRQFLPYKSYRMVDTALIRSEGQSRGLMSGPDDHSYQFTLDHSRYKRDGKIHIRSFGISDRSQVNNPTLIGTSFVVEEKETIVVGTSKLNGGDQALIVLFTAID